MAMDDQVCLIKVILIVLVSGCVFLGKFVSLSHYCETSKASVSFVTSIIFTNIIIINLKLLSLMIHYFWLSTQSIGKRDLSPLSRQYINLSSFNILSYGLRSKSLCCPVCLFRMHDTMNSDADCFSLHQDTLSIQLPQQTNNQQSSEGSTCPLSQPSRTSKHVDVMIVRSTSSYSCCV